MQPSPTHTQTHTHTHTHTNTYRQAHVHTHRHTHRHTHTQTHTHTPRFPSVLYGDCRQRSPYFGYLFRVSFLRVSFFFGAVEQCIRLSGGDSAASFHGLSFVFSSCSRFLFCFLLVRVSKLKQKNPKYSNPSQPETNYDPAKPDKAK